MSGAQTSTFADPTILYKTLSGAGYQEVEQNRLLNQGAQQDIGLKDMAAVGQAGASLLNLNEDQAAAAYGPMRDSLQAQGFGKNLPPTYPGHAVTQAFVQRAMPILQQIQTGFLTTPGSADATKRLNDIYTGATGTGTGTGTTTGSTPTIGGTDTAPINAAGDSRTRKAAEGGPPAPGTPAAATAQQVHDFWISKGFSEPVVAGIMAGGPGSESDFNPSVVGDKGTSIGLYQHHGPRADAMRQFFNLSPGQMPSADQQNQYAHWEITQGPLKNVGAMLQAAKTPAEAAAIWTQYFGVPADKTEIGRRAAGAQRFVGLYGQPQQGGPGGSTAPVAPPGVQMGGTAPPPPGGSTAPYTGGGIGAVVAPGGPAGRQLTQAERLGGTQVAGPPMVASTNPTAPTPATDPLATPARYAGTAPAPSVEAPPETGWGTQVGSGYGPQNTLAPQPPAPAQPAVPAQPAAAAPAQQQPPAPPSAQPVPPAARSNLPRAADVPQGLNSPQIQQAQRLQQAASQIEMEAARNPFDKRLQAEAAAKAADLRQRAQIQMQSDNVVQTQDGQLHTLTGVIDKPVPHFVWDEKQGAYVDTTGSTAPVTPPSPRLLNVEGVGVVQSKPGGGATLVVPQNTAGITAAEASKALGKATGTDVAKQVPQYMQIGQRADQAINVIDSGIQHLAEAAKGNIPSGYFAPWLATGAAAMKSLGVDLQTLGIDPKAVGDVQTAQKTLGIVSGAILQNTLGKDSQITDAKIEHFIHTQPDLAMDPNALSRILQWARTQFVFEHDMAIDAMKTAATSPSGTLPLNWAPSYFAAKGGFGPIYNPLTGQSTLPTGEGVAREPPASQPSGGTIIRYDARGKRLP